MNQLIYQRAIEQFCERVVEKFQPDCIILHGSVARGTYTAKSDVDLIVIGDSLNPNFLTRLFELNELQDGTTPFEILGYTLIEWERMLSRFHLTTLEALQWGIPVYGEALFAQWQASLDAWKSLGLQRGEVSWVIPPQLDSITVG